MTHTVWFKKNKAKQIRIHVVSPNAFQDPHCSPHSMEMIRSKFQSTRPNISNLHVTTKQYFLRFTGHPLRYKAAYCAISVQPLSYTNTASHTFGSILCRNHKLCFISPSFHPRVPSSQTGKKHQEQKKKTNLKKKNLIRILWKVRHKRQRKSASHIVRKPQIIPLYFIAILLCLNWESKRHSHTNRFISTVIKARKQDPP
jgi:hypothetical protein